MEGYFCYSSMSDLPCIQDKVTHEYKNVIPETVGQYTGLTDKNGKKIFEGDIMTFSAYGKEYIGIVEIVNGSACVSCEYGRKASPYLDTAAFHYGATVIGNIHDNPELLKEAEHE